MSKAASQQKPTKQPTKRNRQKPPAEQTLIDHLHELRKRLFSVVLILIIGAAVGLQMKDQLIAVVMAPLHGEKLIYLTPGGGFSFILTLSIYFGVLIAIPFASYHIFRFLQPLIGKTSQLLIVGVLATSTFLAVAGALFGYFVTVPAALNFLTSFAGDTVTPNLTAESYLNFVVSYVLGLAILFQLPLLLFMIDHVRPLPPGMLASTQRFVVIGATIAAAIITPTPDAVNMALVAVPIVAVYEVGAVSVFVRHRAGQTLSGKKRRASQVVDTHSADEEPLTATIEKRKEPEELYRSIPFIVDAATEPTAVTAPPPPSRPVRTVDGFIPYPRPRPTSVTVPQRPTPRPQRSIDGLSVI